MPHLQELAPRSTQLSSHTPHIDSKRQMPAPTFYARSVTELIELRAGEFRLVAVTSSGTDSERNKVMSLLFILVLPSSGKNYRRLREYDRLISKSC